MAKEMNYKEADECYKNLIPTVERILGPDNRNTLTIKFVYAVTLRALKKYEEAKQIEMQVIRGRE